METWISEILKPGFLKFLPPPTMNLNLRVGHGYDIHRTKAGRPMILGGVRFTESAAGLDGHSDADCLTHAICDALLGAAALPDIGHFFPNTDPALKNIDSQILLRRVVAALAERGWKPANIDATLIAEQPKIQPRLAAMKTTLAASLGIPADCVGLKATTNEGSDDTGKGLAVAAHAVALISKAQ
jgi:2-C-methyl-D-erythritol 2,4-cyclodiphosphate synthase